MWMTPPAGMCRKHLLGEHVELHMLLGSLRRGKSIDGFISGRLVDPQMVFARHALLVDNVRYFSHIEKIEVARQVG